MQRILCLLVFTLFSVLSTIAYGQKKQALDSAINVIKRDYDGSTQIDKLNELSKSFYRKHPKIADSLNTLILKHPALKNHTIGEAYLYKGIGDLQYYLGSIDSCINALRKSLQLFTNAKSVDGQIRVFHNLSHALDEHHMMDSAIFYEKKAFDQSIKKKDSLFIRVTGKGLGAKFRSVGKLDSAVFYLTLALKYAKENSAAKGDVLFSIGNVFISKGDYSEALQYLNDALIYFKPENKEYQRYMLYNSMGAAKTGLLEYDSAAYYYSMSLKLSRKFKDHRTISNLYSNIGMAYNFTQKFDSAIHLATQGSELAKEHGHLFGHANNLLTLTSAYVGLNNWKKVKSTAKEAALLFDSLMNDEKRLEVLELVAEAEYELGNSDQAFLAQKELFEGYRVFQNSQKQQIISELKTKYETEKKETKIASLSQQSTIQALEIEQKNLGILIGTVLLVILAFVVYLIIRQRTLRNTQSQMELEQRFLRSQLNPHFISNALLAVQNFMLKKQPDEAAVYLSKFSKLMRETLENSRQEFIILEDELQMLKNYIDIHQMRMNDSFDYEIHLGEGIDPETDTIPPMFVQPFVENAIEHGMVSAKERGKIDLFFEKEGEYISIVVKDNGKGLDVDGVSAKGHNSLSSTIIQERMDLFNKTLKRKIQLMLASIKNDNGEIQGTKVELKVPFSYL